MIIDEWLQKNPTKRWIISIDFNESLNLFNITAQEDEKRIITGSGPTFSGALENLETMLS